MEIDEFIPRWQESDGSEHANCQLFVIKMTALLGFERSSVQPLLESLAALGQAETVVEGKCAV